MMIASVIANMDTNPLTSKGLETRVRRFAMDAVTKGADVLFLPEYFSMIILGSAPDDLRETEEVSWMAEQLDNFELQIAEIADQWNIAILAGTWPAASESGYRNMAYFVKSDGQIIAQPKLHLTREERDRLGWYLQPGRKINPFAFDWDLDHPFSSGRTPTCGICICHDTVSDREEEEWREAGADLLFVPSQTEIEGNESAVDSHAYIFEHARLRSEQLRCKVVALGGAGTQTFPNRPSRAPQPNVGGAALFDKGKQVFYAGPFSEIGSKGAMVVFEV